MGLNLYLNVDEDSEEEKRIHAIENVPLGPRIGSYLFVHVLRLAWIAATHKMITEEERRGPKVKRVEALAYLASWVHPNYHFLLEDPNRVDIENKDGPSAKKLVAAIQYEEMAFSKGVKIGITHSCGWQGSAQRKSMNVHPDLNIDTHPETLQEWYVAGELLHSKLPKDIVQIVQQFCARGSDILRPYGLEGTYYFVDHCDCDCTWSPEQSKQVLITFNKIRHYLPKNYADGWDNERVSDLLEIAVRHQVDIRFA